MISKEQGAFAEHVSGAFVEACPGAGKTRTVAARVRRIATTLPPRRGLAILSFTNSAIAAFVEQCHGAKMDTALKFPNFLGTFDAFLRHFLIAPSGIFNVPKRPIVVDSWESLGIQIRLGGKKSFAGPGVVLDKFDPGTNKIDVNVIGHAGLRTHVQSNKEAYERLAAQRRKGLRSAGYLSAADVRIEVLQRLQDLTISKALGRALAARFQEVIVDEAQDCNPFDIQIISWLRDHDLAVTVVADPDQAIYGFRHGNPDHLLKLAESYDKKDRLVLTGNFRCTPAICALAATLRSRAKPDDSCGETAGVEIPILILSYARNAFNRIGTEFIQILAKEKIDTSKTIVLAHARTTARRACDLGSTTKETGGSNLATIARAVGEFWLLTGSNTVREASLQTVERMILDMMGKIQNGESPARACEDNGIDSRWLRRSALELITALPRSCAASESGIPMWVAALHAAVKRLGLPYREKTSERTYFRTQTKSAWQQHLRTTEIQGIKCATIHEAKGHEYDAVCVVIPPDYGGREYTTGLFANWEKRTNDEAKRVIYVGITRAKRSVALAIPSEFRDRLIAILQKANVAFTVRDIEPPTATAAAPK